MSTGCPWSTGADSRSGTYDSVGGGVGFVISPFRKEAGLLDETTPQADDVGLDGPAPEWVNAWMPQRHVDIVAEIERLRSEAEQIESLGRLLWQAGRPLEEAVRDVFRAVSLQAELTSAEPTCDLLVGLGDGKRHLLSVTGTEGNITNKSAKIKQVFQAAQELSEGDRIVFVGNVHRGRPVADREWLDPVSGDAMMVLKGLGVVFVTTATLFRIWTLSRENQQAAIDQMGQLHASAPGLFALETSSADLPFDADGADESEETAGFADRLVNALKA